MLATSYVARFATRSKHGVPALTPLWFIVARGRLYAGTADATLAVRNLRSCPGMAVLLDGESAGPRSRILRLRGHALVHRAMPGLRVLAQLASKYYIRGLRSEIRHARLWPLRRRYYAQSEAAVIEFVPEVAEWLHVDGARLASPP